MDFRSFPKDKHGFNAVLVVVDRLTKRPISLLCYKTIGAPELAQLFISGVIRYCGLPDLIISNCGGQFVSEFWTEVCRILGIKRKLSTAHHPQTDG
jgi:transposase InsO family protein